jgi:hypothetical protein
MVDCGCRIDVTPKYPDDGFTEVGVAKAKAAGESKGDSEDDGAEPSPADAPAAAAKAAKRRADSAAVVLQGPLDSVLLAHAVIDGLHKALPSKAPMRLQTAFDMARTIAANHGQMLPVPPPGKDHASSHVGKLINVYKPAGELVAIRYGPDGVVVPHTKVSPPPETKADTKPVTKTGTEGRPAAQVHAPASQVPAPASFAAAVSGAAHTTAPVKPGSAVSGSGEAVVSTVGAPKKASVSTRGGASASSPRGGRGRGGRGGSNSGVVKPDTTTADVSAPKPPAAATPASASKRGRGGRAAGPPLATASGASKDEKDSGKQAPAPAPAARGGARGRGARGRFAHADRPAGALAPDAKEVAVSS